MQRELRNRSIAFVVHYTGEVRVQLCMLEENGQSCNTGQSSMSHARSWAVPCRLISAALSDGLALDASELLSLLFHLPEDDLLCAVKHCQLVLIEINMSILD